MCSALAYGVRLCVQVVCGEPINSSDSPDEYDRGGDLGETHLTDPQRTQYILPVSIVSN